MVRRALVFWLFFAACFHDAGSSAVETRSGPAMDWDKIVSGAKQEGHVTVYGAPEVSMQNAFLEFEKFYPQIKVALVSGSGSNIVPRIIAERRADKYLMDVSLFGHGSRVTLQKGKALDPVAAALLLPELNDRAKQGGLVHHSGFWRDRNRQPGAPSERRRTADQLVLSPNG
jgi:ABC-type glycerol-3-phosphate transport system substrate-binding protein